MCDGETSDKQPGEVMLRLRSDLRVKQKRRVLCQEHRTWELGAYWDIDMAERAGQDAGAWRRKEAEK